MWVLLGLCLVQGYEASAPSTFDVGQDISLYIGEFAESQHSAFSEDPTIAWPNRDSGCENDGTLDKPREAEKLI
jgi:hypothetical protein